MAVVRVTPVKLDLDGLRLMAAALHLRMIKLQEFQGDRYALCDERGEIVFVVRESGGAAGRSGSASLN
jgi:hypothetical protein